MDNSTVEAVCKILCPTVIGCEQRQRMDKILKDAGCVKVEPAIVSYVQTICPKCEKPISADKQYCSSCEPAEDLWKCPSCGREDTEPMYAICECGTELEKVQADDSGSLAAWIKADESELQLEGEIAPIPQSEIDDLFKHYDGALLNDSCLFNIICVLWSRATKAQLAHDKARMEELEATIVAAMSTIDGLTEDWEKSKRAMHEVQSICNYLMQDNTELAEKVAKIEKIVLLAQELLKLLKGEHDEA